MEDIIKNKMFWVVVAIFGLNLGFFVGGKIIIDKAADKVIERLEKDYSPSPYGPGFDPDRVNTVRSVVYELKTTSKDGSVFEKEFATPSFKASLNKAEDWRDEWENDRMVNLER